MTRGAASLKQKGMINSKGLLINTLEWGYGGTLGLVQSRGYDGSVAEVDLAVRLLLEREGVLHPFLVVTVGEILAGVGAT